MEDRTENRLSEGGGDVEDRIENKMREVGWISRKEDRTENRLSGGNAKIFQTRRTEQRRRIGEGGLG